MNEPEQQYDPPAVEEIDTGMGAFDAEAIIGGPPGTSFAEAAGKIIDGD
jgi:hypothetical protein